VVILGPLSEVSWASFDQKTLKDQPSRKNRILFPVQETSNQLLLMGLHIKVLIVNMKTARIEVSELKSVFGIRLSFVGPT
jgi:hypothetical protein